MLNYAKHRPGGGHEVIMANVASGHDSSPLERGSAMQQPPIVSQQYLSWPQLELGQVLVLLGHLDELAVVVIEFQLSLQIHIMWSPVISIEPDLLHAKIRGKALLHAFRRLGNHFYLSLTVLKITSLLK